MLRPVLPFFALSLSLGFALAACAPTTGTSPDLPATPTPETSAAASASPTEPTDSTDTAGETAGTTERLDVALPSAFFEPGSTLDVSLLTAAEAAQVDSNRDWQKDCYAFIAAGAELSATTALRLPPGGDSQALFDCQSRRNREVKAVTPQNFKVQVKDTGIALQNLNLAAGQDYRLELSGQPASTCFPAQARLAFTAGGPSLKLESLKQPSDFAVLPSDPRRPLFDSSCLHGQVRDVNGAPIAEALVAAAPGAEHSAPFRGGVLTDAQGKYRIELPYFTPFANHPFQLLVTQDGYHPQRATGTLMLNSEFSAEDNRYDFTLGNSSTRIDTARFDLQNDGNGVDSDYGVTLTLKRRDQQATPRVDELAFETVREKSYSAQELAQGIRLNNTALNFGDYYRLDLSAHLEGDSCRTGVASYSNVLDRDRVELKTSDFSDFDAKASCTHAFPLELTVTNQSGRGLNANVTVSWLEVNPLNGSLVETRYANDSDANGKLVTPAIVLDDGPSKELTITVRKSGFVTQTVNHTLRKPNGDLSHTQLNVKLSASVN